MSSNLFLSQGGALARGSCAPWADSAATGYVVIELKTGKFQPECAGRLNVYVALGDDVLRRGHHNETIGFLICGTKNDRSVRYSLGRCTSPMAVAGYAYDKLPQAKQKRGSDSGGQFR